MSLPPVDAVRERIRGVSREDVRVCLMATYLFCARISELVAHACPGDSHTTARGPLGVNVNVTDFELGSLKAEAAVFKVATAKRGGIPRLIALPLNPDYEPWTQPVYSHFKDCGENPVFPFTRQLVWKHSKDAFEGTFYPIERYKYLPKGEVERKIKDAHPRAFRLHALRHLRTTELIEVYGFDGFDLSIYGGWSLKSTIGVGGAMERYAHLQWRKYFPKLLKRRSLG